MITNFQVSPKTAKPFCSWDCCGCKFGRISHRTAKVHSSTNRIIKARRYAKRVEKRLWKKELILQLELED